MELFLHQFFAGLATGGIYASIALALVMIYRATHHINFAQGEMATLSTYAALTLITAGLPYWVAFVLTVVGSFAMGVAIERLVIRRMDKAPPMASIIVMLGLLVLINAVVILAFGGSVTTFPSPFPTKPPMGIHLFSSHQLGSTAVMLVMLGLVYAFFRFTRLGLAMRASAENAVSSRLSGVPVGRMLALGWGLAAAIGAIAGMMIAPIVFLDPNTMGNILLYGFAAAVLGGIDNPWGAAAGGFLIGVVENLLGAYVIGTDLKLTVALVAIVATLLVRPAGLFGRSFVTRV
jgi:branched-chain amino acid transport system permease protein